MKIIVNETICLNSKVNGKQPSLKDRVYDGGGAIIRHHDRDVLHGKDTGGKHG